jgi:hypothetical protein
MNMLRSIASTFFGREVSDENLLSRCWKEFQYQLFLRNNMGKRPSQVKVEDAISKFLGKTSNPFLKPPNSVFFELTIQKPAYLRGEFIVSNFITQKQDRFDFEVFVSADYSDELDRPSGHKSVVVRMPHWKFVRSIDDYPDQNILCDFLIEESKERVGPEAILKAMGIDLG